MENEYVTMDICVNCGYDFQPENHVQLKQCSFPWVWKGKEQLNDEFSETEIQIKDAISQIFGLTFQDLYPEKDFDNEIHIRNVVLCSECAFLLEKLFDAFHGMKIASGENSLLWNSVESKRANRVNSEILDRRKYQSYVDVKKEIASDFNPSDNVENGIEVYTEILSLHKPQIHISEGFFDDDATEDPLLNSHLDLDQGLKIGDNNEFDHKTFPGKKCFRKKQSKTYLPCIKSKNRKKFYFKPRENHLQSEGTLKPERGARSARSKNKKSPWLVKHLDTLSGVVPIKCCQTPFENEVDFISHVNLNHENESELSEQECQFCNRKILSKYMHFHVNVLHQGKLMVYECSVCKRTFLKEWRLAIHKAKEHGTKSRRWAHLGVGRTNSKIFCEKCNKYFDYKYYTAYHVPSVHKTDGERHECHICGSSIKSAELLKLHIAITHPKDSSGKICEKCGKIFPHRKALTSHRVIHEADFLPSSEKEKFKCNQCGIILKHTASLRKHTRLMHGKAALKTFCCEICGKITKNMTNMRIHMKVHDPNRKFKPKIKPENAENPESLFV